MGKLKVDQYVVGAVQTNCYFAVNDETKEVLVIDPGASAGQLAERIRMDGYQPAAILLTHGHFDHAGGAKELAESFGIPVYAHRDEQETLESPELNASWMMGLSETYEADCYVKDEEELDLGGFHIRVLHTPGHTVGGCCYYLPYEEAVFSGDTLFSMSVGRTDFAKGSAARLIKSIQDKLMVLPPNTTVYPGHNEVTTIEYERMYNPYL